MVGTDDNPDNVNENGNTDDNVNENGTSGGAGSDVVADDGADVQATFCATLVDEWSRLGLRHAVIAPGSRSTPMALALAERADFDIHVVHDERVAAFVALGLGCSGTPALLLCTSGTAAANFFPAVVEAGLSDVPMIVLTADRPPELRGVGAPQTIDQVDLYGGHVRWFHDAEVATIEHADSWRPLARQASAAATRGPVQLNLGFREPLLGTRLPLPDGPPTRSGDRPELAGPELAGPELGVMESVAAPVPSALVVGPDVWRGVILVGGRSSIAEASISRLHAATGWPLIADPISAMRHLDGVVTSVDSLLRHPRFADAHRPTSVVRIGRPSTSKTLAQWVDRAVADGATLVQVGGPGVIDPAHNVSARCTIDDVVAACAQVTPDPAWAASWGAADAAADAAIAATLETLEARGELNEPGVARIVSGHIPATTRLVVSSSMPVRDHEWFGGRRAVAHANRGANGIDGVMSTALGCALADGSATVLIGDLAFVHDSNALVALAARGTDLRVVVVDNDGGGIFSFLPQAAELSSDRFEQLFGTPHGTDVLALAASHGVDGIEVTTAAQLVDVLQRSGPWVARVRSTRDRNVEVHRMLHDAVATALR